VKRPSRGEVWIADLEPVRGHEQGGRPRPVLILSVNALNHSHAGLSMAIPLTGTDRSLPSHVPLEPPLGGLTKTSYAMCDQLRTIAHERLASRLGAVDQQTLETIEKVLCRLLGFRR